MPTELQRACAPPPRAGAHRPPVQPSAPHSTRRGRRWRGDVRRGDRRSAMETYASIGKSPIHIRAELPGHVTNRLQAALWREAYWLVEQGVVSVAEVDRAISSGPGLRWALLGPFATQHLSGGDGGHRPRARTPRPADGRVVADDAARRSGRRSCGRPWSPASTTNSTASTRRAWPTSGIGSSKSSSSPRPAPTTSREAAIR